MFSYRNTKNDCENIDSVSMCNHVKYIYTLNLKLLFIVASRAGDDEKLKIKYLMRKMQCVFRGKKLRTYEKRTKKTRSSDTSCPFSSKAFLAREELMYFCYLSWKMPLFPAKFLEWRLQLSICPVAISHSNHVIIDITHAL